MLPELASIFKNFEDHVFILSIEVSSSIENENLDLIDDILCMDILKTALTPEYLEYVICNVDVFDLIKGILFTEAKYFTHKKNIIIAIKIKNIIHSDTNLE